MLDLSVFAGRCLPGSAQATLSLTLWKGWVQTCTACCLLPCVYSGLLSAALFPCCLCSAGGGVPQAANIALGHRARPWVELLSAAGVDMAPGQHPS